MKHILMSISVMYSNYSIIFTLRVKIYIAPSKALVQEKLRDWNKKFGPLGINCLELTGDNESYTPRNILEADIILTTPEVSKMEEHKQIKTICYSFL